MQLGENALRHEWADSHAANSATGAEVAVTKTVRFHWAYTRHVWQVASRIKPGDPLAAANFSRFKRTC